MNASILTLDKESIQPDALSMPALMRELNLQQKPSWLLSLLMNALEKKRQARGLGWSRAWNKVGMNIFRTHALDRGKDGTLLSDTRRLLGEALAESPEGARTFVEELMEDEKSMGFIFYHNHTAETGRQHEGLTVSFGRKVAGEPSKRDRVDLILEDERVDGRVDGMLDRIRIYVCPWSDYGRDRTFHLREIHQPVQADLKLYQPYYRRQLELYREWRSDDSRQWDHWSVRYIDYFGPRQFIPQGSSFL